MKTYFQNRQNELFKAYQTSVALGHSVPKGQERELIASQFLVQHLPPSIEVTTGVLIDQNTTDFNLLSQTTSPQIDLLLANTDFPQLTLYGGSRLYFAESVVAVIEVKTKLTASKFQDILVHCKKVKERKRQITGLYSAIPGDKSSEPSERVPYYVIAFESEIYGKGIMNSLKNEAQKLGLSIDAQKDIQPDGFFVINPATGTVVLKDIGLHGLRSDILYPPYYGGEVEKDSLCALYITLLAQIGSIRLLNFPHKTYMKKLFPNTDKPM